MRSRRRTFLLSFAEGSVGIRVHFNRDGPINNVNGPFTDHTQNDTDSGTSGISYFRRRGDRGRVHLVLSEERRPQTRPGDNSGHD